MTTILVTAGKGSPGATTTAAALAAVTAFKADRDTLLMELDPAGGTLALGTQIPLDPGLLTLAAAGRRGLDPALLHAHSQALANGVGVIVAPTSPDRAASIARSLSAPISEAASDLDGVVIIDCGRWSNEHHLAPLAAAADEVLVTFRPDAAGVEHVRTRLGSITAASRSVRLVSIGDTPYPAAEVAGVLGVEAVQVIADDRRTAELIRTAAPIGRWLRRTSLVRSVSALADQLSICTESAEAAEAPPPVEVPA